MLLHKPSYDSLALAALGAFEVLLAFALAGFRARLESPVAPRAGNEAPSLSEPTPFSGVSAEG